MKLLSRINNLFTSGYKNNPDAIVIACYFNPQRNEYRKQAFDKWYSTIKHLNHFVLEAVPHGSPPELPDILGKIEHIQVEQMLWHKETLLNKIINRVVQEGKFKYIFWLDTDVIFDNRSWLVDACKELENYNVVQPFEYCLHLDRNELPEKNQFFTKGIDLGNYIKDWANQGKIWRSFGSNVKDKPKNAMSDDYDIHGHVGFAWGARTSYLKQIGGLYDKALIGGADHIMAHAFVGQIPCSCIAKSFGENSDITEWSRMAYYVNDVPYMSGISYAKGNLFHIWHGDIEKREYYKRIKEFTPMSTGKVNRDETGFYQTSDSNVSDYFLNYLEQRENVSSNYTFHNDTITFDVPIQESSFEGGQFGGSGAGEDWIDQPTEPANNTETYNPTFS